MTFHASKFLPINPFDPETLLSLASDLRDFQKTGDPVGVDRGSSPVISNWSRTLLPHSAIIGSLNHDTVLQPLFALTEDRSWALLSQGWYRLEDHAETFVSNGRRIRSQSQIT
ncbi:MAG: hypothetical protein JJ866_20275 [Roseibium sp.]|uniref:hypothetical protein n=1 Tax=Roseibium sp. TaxID=1936156 RepID=UPI001B2C3A46|nr:hypothetical protein [Roseibium sp.]MBO6894291.1 hypothetical protein [Roseibium sp.]MBO6930911.1 hypothetical protein [Roseibium sp.]